MIHSYEISGLSVQTGDILCMAFDGEDVVNPGDYWRILGLLIPGEVDHVAVYVGSGGLCVEVSARGVYTFNLEDNQWAPEKMFKHRGVFKDHLNWCGLSTAWVRCDQGSGRENSAACGRILPCPS